MAVGLTLNKITAQKGINVGEAARRITDLGWQPSYVQEAMTFPTDYKIGKAPRDPMKQVPRSYFPMQEVKGQPRLRRAGRCPARRHVPQHPAALG